MATPNNNSTSTLSARANAPPEESTFDLRGAYMKSGNIAGDNVFQQVEVHRICPTTSGDETDGISPSYPGPPASFNVDRSTKLMGGIIAGKEIFDNSVVHISRVSPERMGSLNLLAGPTPSRKSHDLTDQVIDGQNFAGFEVLEKRKSPPTTRRTDAPTRQSTVGEIARNMRRDLAQGHLDPASVADRCRREVTRATGAGEVPRGDSLIICSKSVFRNTSIFSVQA